MDAHLLLKVINHRENSPKALIGRMMYNVKNDSNLMHAYGAIADHIGGKTPRCQDLITIIEVALTERYVKTMLGGGEEVARNYVSSLLDDLVECLFASEKETWPTAKEALHKKFAVAPKSAGEPALTRA